MELERVIITTDLGYGDAGKGSVVDALTDRFNIDLVVRYSGGAQAAHNVITPNGRHHTFAQFGSGSFKAGTRTYLGPKMLVSPSALLKEAEALKTLGVTEPLAHITVDPDAPVITPYHQLVNQLKELARGMGRHGSTGIGIGETRADAEDSAVDHMTAVDLLDPAHAARKLAQVREQKRSQALELLHQHANNGDIVNTWHRFDDKTLFQDTLAHYAVFRSNVSIEDASIVRSHLRRGGRVIFEAAQGTLLDEDYGFFPYVTRGKVRSVHAHELLASIDYRERPYVLGITRAYAARHGPGPFPTENAWLQSRVHETHNTNGRWQGAFRIGHFDAVATRYAIAVNEQVDGLAVTCLDQLPGDADFLFASHYTDAHDREIYDLPLPTPGDLPTLSARSDYLMREVTPHYRATRIEREDVPTLIGTLLERPIALTSWGMTRNDKLFFPQTTEHRLVA